MSAHGTAQPMTAHRSGPLSGRAEVPGDKSISHRALIFGAMAVGETKITGLLEGQDVLDTAKAMRAFGAEVTRHGEGAWSVHGVGVGGFSRTRRRDRLRQLGNRRAPHHGLHGHDRDDRDLHGRRLACASGRWGG